ncbi:MAG TPA: hypothetical protein VHK63_05345 [Candidatus Limnocylindria bacterium]|nr:hypothetical protein [Candidatus Limnocylindria bacterium]
MEPPDNSPYQPSYPPGYVPPAAPAPLPARPGVVTVAGVVLIVLGVLTTIIGLVVTLAGALFGDIVGMPEFRSQLPNVPEAMGGVLLVVGLVFVAFAALQVLGGIFVLTGRTWARIAALVAASLGALMSLAFVIPTGDFGLGNAIGLAVLAAYAYVAWVMASGGSWFRR